jgi:hypothetical protein
VRSDANRLDVVLEKDFKLQLIDSGVPENSNSFVLPFSHYLLSTFRHVTPPSFCSARVKQNFGLGYRQGSAYVSFCVQYLSVLLDYLGVHATSRQCEPSPLLLFRCFFFFSDVLLLWLG